MQPEPIVTVMGSPLARELTLLPKRTALLVIDMQRLNTDPEGLIGRRALEQRQFEQIRWRFERMKTVVPNIQRLLTACRGSRIQVIYLKIQAFTRDGRDFGKWLGALFPGQFVPGSPEVEILAAIAPGPDDIVLTKTSVSAFTSSPLDHVLRNLGVDTLLATGASTDGCVEWTVEDAVDRGYTVLLVSDGTGCSTREGQESAESRLGARFVYVRDTERVLRLIEAARHSES